MFLVDFNFTNLPSLTEELTLSHRQHLANAYRTGELAFGGPKSPRTGGIIVSRHRQRDQLEHLLETDPLVLAGLANFTITEFNVALTSEAFEGIAV